MIVFGYTDDVNSITLDIQNESASGDHLRRSPKVITQKRAEFLNKVLMDIGYERKSYLNRSEYTRKQETIGSLNEIEYSITYWFTDEPGRMKRTSDRKESSFISRQFALADIRDKIEDGWTFKIDTHFLHVYRIDGLKHRA